MTVVNPSASQQAVVEAALVLLERMGLSPADLTAVPQPRKPAPTFAEYVPVVSAAVSDGTRRAYGSYWNRIVDHWGDRRLDEPTPSEIRQLMAYVKTHVVRRRNARGGRSAEEHLVAALRCLYQRAVDDGLIGVVERVLLRVDHPQVAVEAIGLAARAADHEGGVRARREANQNPFVRAVELLQMVAAQVILELMIHDVGGQDERDLAELRELALQFGRAER